MKYSDLRECARQRAIRERRYIARTVAGSRDDALKALDSRLGRVLAAITEADMRDATRAILADDRFSKQDRYRAALAEKAPCGQAERTVTLTPTVAQQMADVLGEMIAQYDDAARVLGSKHTGGIYLKGARIDAMRAALARFEATR